MHSWSPPVLGSLLAMSKGLAPEYAVSAWHGNKSYPVLPRALKTCSDGDGKGVTAYQRWVPREPGLAILSRSVGCSWTPVSGFGEGGSVLAARN